MVHVECPNLECGNDFDCDWIPRQYMDTVLEIECDMCGKQLEVSVDIRVDIIK